MPRWRHTDLLTVQRLDFSGSDVFFGACQACPDDRGRTWTDFLTLRNDQAAYVTVSDDGLQFETPRGWRFDDGEPLGSYNIQQHWVTHGDRAWLV